MMKAFLICLLAAPAIAAEPLDDYKALVEARFAAQEKWIIEAIRNQDEKTRIAMNASEKAVDKAEKSSNERFNSHNEFREQLKTQAATFLTRDEARAYLFAMLGFTTTIIGLMSFLQRQKNG